MKINQKGFSAAEVLVILVISILIGSAGLLVYGRQKSDEYSKKQSKGLYAQMKMQCGKDPYALVKESHFNDGGTDDYVYQADQEVSKSKVEYYCNKQAAINASRGFLYVDGRVYDKQYEAELLSLNSGQKYYKPSLTPDGLSIYSKNHNNEGKIYSVEYKLVSVSGQSTLPPLDLTCEYDKQSLGLASIQKDYLSILAKTDSGKPIIKIPVGTNQHVSLKIFLDDTACSAIATDKSISENAVVSVLKSISEISPKDFLAYYK